MFSTVTDYVCRTGFEYDYDSHGDEINTQINILAQEFEKSAEAEGTTSADPTATFFCDMLFNYQGVTIADCTLNDLRETVENTIPRKMTMREKSEAEEFIAELILFWKYLKQAYNHPKADSFVAYLESVRMKFVDWMFDPSKAGMSKSMFMNAPGGMPNFESKEDLERFIIEHNLRIAESQGMPKLPNILQFPVTRESPKVGRNDQCPCGSGKKFKKCCGK